ncbi:hypothetical protein V1527DRAFT_328786 [Lipomyces starkeyi]
MLRPQLASVRYRSNADITCVKIKTKALQVFDVAIELHVRNLISCLAQSGTASVDIQEPFYRITPSSAQFLFGESQSLRPTAASRDCKTDKNVLAVVSDDSSRQGFAHAFNYCQEILAVRAIMRSLNKPTKNALPPREGM